MADYYTLLTNAGIAYETACKAAGVPIKLAQISVGDGNGAVYNPDASAKALKREVWRGPLNALFQDEKNANWLMAEVTIPSDVGGWYVREAGLWTDTGILYAVVKYPESYKPVLATSGSGKEFYIRSIFETSNAAIVTLLIDDTVVKATRAWVMDYLKQGTYSKAEIEAMIAQSSALPVGSMVAFPVDKVPVGFLEIDGSVKSASAYPDLAKFLGAAFNKGDEGAGNFRLPESRGEFLRGWDHGRGVDAARMIGSPQLDAFQGFTPAGSIAYSKHDSARFKDLRGVPCFNGAGGTTPAIALDWDATVVSVDSWSLTGGFIVSDDVHGTPRVESETRPRNLAVMWCIKAWNAPINQGNIDIAALVSELDALKSAVPVGSIVPFPKAAVPPGYLELDGSVQSIAAYPDLASYLGTTFNTGSEAAGFFRLPESRGEFLRGWDHGRGVDAARVIGSSQAQTVQKHDHAMWSGGSYASTTPAGGGAAAAWVNGAVTDMRTGIAGSDETRPRNLAVMWCIKAWNAPVNQGSVDIAALALLATQATENNQGTAKVATQPMTDAGVDDATIVTPKKMRFGFAMNFTAASGYVLFPTWLGGLLIQYGRASLAADQFTTLTWPLAWPDACYAISGAVHSSLARVDDGISAQYRNLTKTTVILDRQDIVSAVANNRDMFVIGIGK
jgi:phage-related tail fiber protein